MDALLDVAEKGRSEMARVQAAKELLDRAGVQQDQHVHIHRPEEDVGPDELLDELRRRLLVATDRLRIQALPVASESDVTFEFSEPAHADGEWATKRTEDDIIEATIVEDDDNDV